VLDSGGVAVLGCCTFDLSACKSWRIHLKCPWKPAPSVTDARPFIAGRRCHGRVVVRTAVKQRSPVRLLGMAFLADPTPVLLRTCTWPGSAVLTMFRQSGYRIRRYVGLRGGYMPGDQPCAEGRADNRAAYVASWRGGVRTSVFVPRPRLGGTNHEGGGSNAAAKRAVLFGVWLPDRPGSDARITSPIDSTLRTAQPQSD
jgi:hypothetical protein